MTRSETPELRLTTTLHPRGPAAALVLSDDEVAHLGEGSKTFPVKLTINSTQLKLRLARMGGENLIGLSKAARAEAGVQIGDVVEVLIERDVAERAVEVPQDLAAALQAEPTAERAFDALAPSHRKEYVRWITEAKRERTRTERVAKTVARLLDQPQG